MDRREQNHKWYKSFDESAMALVVEVEDENGDDCDITVAAQFAICETCNGKGSHVNPSIDSHGLSREDFDADPDFEEDYFSGKYDVRCNECKGKRVVPELSDYVKEADRKLVMEARYRAVRYARECEHERRMGY